MGGHGALDGHLDLRAPGSPDGLDDEPRAVGAHVELGLPVDVQELEDWLLDDDPEAVANGRELLSHDFTPF